MYPFRMKNTKSVDKRSDLGLLTESEWDPSSEEKKYGIEKERNVENLERAKLHTQFRLISLF